MEKNDPRPEPLDELPAAYYNKGKNVLIKEYVHSFVMQQLEMHGMGHSKLNMNVVDDMTSDIISDIFNMVSSNSIESLNDAVIKQGGYIYNKTNKYNLNIILSNVKIKVYVGFTARVARENFTVATSFGLYDFTGIIQSARDRGSYRIEIYNIVQGMTVSDYMIRDKTHAGLWNCYGKSHAATEENEMRKVAIELIKDIDVLLDAVCQYVVNNYYYRCFTELRDASPDPENFDFDENESVFYPNDNNIGNFVIVSNGGNDGYETIHQRVHNIDMDQWNTTSVHKMIHNIAIQIIGRMYNRDTYPDEHSADMLIDYRNGDTLFNRINQFKKMFYDKIDKPDWFRPDDIGTYSFWGSGLNLSPAIIRLYLEEMKSIGAPMTEEDRLKVYLAGSEHNVDYIQESANNAAKEKKQSNKGADDE